MRFLIVIFFCFFNAIFAQKQYTTSDDPRINRVDFSVILPYGTSRFSSIDSPKLIRVIGTVDEKLLKSEYKYALIKNIKRVSFKVFDAKNEGKAGYEVNIFDSKDKIEKKSQWDLFLSKSKDFNLKVKLGIGNANFNLSGLALRNAHFYSASADATINYFKGQGNTREIDTLNIKTDLGNVYCNNIDLARARLFNAEIGFGSLVLNYGGNTTVSAVQVKIGTGKLLVNIPKKDVPVKIKINASPLAKIEIPPGFKKKEGNIYINEYFYESAPNALFFNIDVSLGKVTFKLN